MSIGERIKNTRIARGYKQAADFARACDISKQTLCNYESDKVLKPDPATLMKIAVRLNVTLDWLWSADGLPGRHQMLDADEWTLIERYRTLSAQGKETLKKHLVDITSNF